MRRFALEFFLNPVPAPGLLPIQDTITRARPSVRPMIVISLPSMCSVLRCGSVGCNGTGDGAPVHTEYDAHFTYCNTASCHTAAYTVIRVKAVSLTTHAHQPRRIVTELGIQPVTHHFEADGVVPRTQHFAVYDSTA